MKLQIERASVKIEVARASPPTWPDQRWAHRSFYRPVGLAPEKAAQATSRINETIDGSVFERWRAEPRTGVPSLTIVRGTSPI